MIIWKLAANIKKNIATAKLYLYTKNFYHFYSSSSVQESTFYILDSDMVNVSYELLSKGHIPNYTLAS